MDSGVWLAAQDRKDPFHEPAGALLAGSSGAAALDLTLYEVANVAVVSWRSPETARDLLDLIADVVQDRLVRVDAELAAAASVLAASSGLTVYDAAYVACARRGGWTLVSCDLRDLVRPGLALAPDEALERREP